MKPDDQRLAWIEELLIKDCSVEGMWEEFRDIVLVNSPNSSKKELRKAFYAGAICLFDMISFLGKNRVEPRLMERFMVSLKNEFLKFAEEQKSGAHHRENPEVSGHGRPH